MQMAGSSCRAVVAAAELHRTCTRSWVLPHTLPATINDAPTCNATPPKSRCMVTCDVSASVTEKCAAAFLLSVFPLCSALHYHLPRCTATRVTTAVGGARVRWQCSERGCAQFGVAAMEQWKRRATKPHRSRNAMQRNATHPSSKRVENDGSLGVHVDVITRAARQPQSISKRAAGHCTASRGRWWARVIPRGWGGGCGALRAEQPPSQTSVHERNIVAQASG